MDRGDLNLHYGSKQHHFIGVIIKFTGGGSQPSSNTYTMLQKMAQVDEG